MISAWYALPDTDPPESFQVSSLANPALSIVKDIESELLLG